MDLDPPALQLLLRLAYRVTMAVGDNLPRLAASLGLTPRDFSAASARLLAEGLAERDELAAGVYRLAVTDRGLARAAPHRPTPAPAPAPDPLPAEFPSPDPEARTPPWRALARLPLLAYRAVRWKLLRGGWLLPHLLRHRRFDRRRLPPDAPVDVLVLVSDHFEPARRAGDEAAAESVRAWCADYEALAGRPSTPGSTATTTPTLLA